MKKIFAFIILIILSYFKQAFSMNLLRAVVNRSLSNTSPSNCNRVLMLRNFTRAYSNRADEWGKRERFNYLKKI